MQPRIREQREYERLEQSHLCTKYYSAVVKAHEEHKSIQVVKLSQIIYGQTLIISYKE